MGARGLWVLGDCDKVLETNFPLEAQQDLIPFMSASTAYGRVLVRSHVEGLLKQRLWPS